MVRSMLLPADAAAAAGALRRAFAPTGVLRVGTNLGNPVIARQDPSGGEPRGVGPELGRELARRLGVPVGYATFPTAGSMAAAVKQEAWDVAFLAVDPARAEDIAFTAPYLLIEGTYMVRDDSPLRRVDEFDREGLRIAVVDKSAYDLWLTRNIRRAQLVKLAASQAAIDAFLAGRADAVAGVKNALAAAAGARAGLRVIDGAFMTIGQAAGVPRAREDAARYLQAFVEEQKANGFVARALAASGIADATVAPPA